MKTNVKKLDMIKKEVTLTLEEYKRLEKLAELAENQGWILVSDRLPDVNKRVLVTMSCEEGLLVVVTNYNKYNNKFMWLSNFGDRIDIADTVTAWKEMPEPWKGENKC